MSHDHKKLQPFESSPSGQNADAWLEALPEKEREALKHTWMLAAQAKADTPTTEAIEAASARFWSAVEARSTLQPAAERQALRRLIRTPGRSWALRSLAVLLLFGLGLGAGWLLRNGLPGNDARPAFLVLIRGGTFAERSPEEQAHIVAAFRDWAEELDQAQRLLAGERLTQDGQVLVREGNAVIEHPLVRTPDRVGGYFVITARDYDEALTLAKACPQLDYGGMVEVRQIVR